MNYCFCVLGWHFFEEFYERLYRIDGAKHVICHREREYFAERPQFFEKVKHDLHFCANRGLEWGGYHQFVEKKMHAAYDFVIFCHDDIVIKDAGFVAELLEKFRDPQIKVIGNGRNGKDWEFRFGKYKDRMFFDDAEDFIVRTVRGSFFAARAEIFSVLDNFPVYWPAKTMKKGNISLRNFGYLVTKRFGRESITYLEPESWLETKYLIELQRGEQRGREAVSEQEAAL